MRRSIDIILGILLLTVPVVFFFRNEDWRWYVDNPSLIWAILAVGVLAGLVGFLYYRYRWARILLPLSFAVAFTGLFIWMCYHSLYVGWILFAFALPMVFVASVFWAVCWLEWRKRVYDQ